MWETRWEVDCRQPPRASLLGARGLAGSRFQWGDAAFRRLPSAKALKKVGMLTLSWRGIITVHRFVFIFWRLKC